MAVIGIDLGTSNSLVAAWTDDGVELVPNALGETLTPSVVSLDEDGTLLVGQAARERLITHPGLSVSAFKRAMGTDRTFALGSKLYRAEDLSALVLRKLRQDAEAFLGATVEEAVISVPAYFDDAQRAATKRAGQLAGLNVERLVNEPSAAALTCRLYDSDSDFTALVFDFGGGTLDVSVVDCFDTMVNVLAVAGDNKLGGTDFDLAIARAYCQANNLLFDALPNADKATLLQRAEQAKKQLSQQETTLLHINTGRLAGELALTQQGLVDVCAPLFQRMSVPLRRALADSDTSAKDISRVVLVGGSCHMPVVRVYLEQLLQRSIDAPFSPDTVVGLGAGLYAALTSQHVQTEGLLRSVVMTDLCPFTLGTSVKNNIEPDKVLFSPIIQRNTALPCSRTKRYYTTGDQQTRVHVDIYQGEQMHARDNLCLGELTVNVPPRPKGKESVDVTFTYDINGILVVDVLVNSTGERHRRLLGGKGRLSEEQVRKRLEELSTLVLNPRDDERCRTLCARAESLYAQATGDLRDAIEARYHDFVQDMHTVSPAMLERLIPRMQRFLDSVEQQVQGMGVLPADVDEEDPLWDDEPLPDDDEDAGNEDADANAADADAAADNAADASGDDADAPSLLDAPAVRRPQ